MDPNSKKKIKKLIAAGALGDTEQMVLLVIPLIHLLPLRGDKLQIGKVP